MSEKLPAGTTYRVRFALAGLEPWCEDFVLGEPMTPDEVDRHLGLYVRRRMSEALAASRPAYPCVNDARDAWIVERRRAGRTWTAIRDELSIIALERGWNELATYQGVKLAHDRYLNKNLV